MFRRECNPCHIKPSIWIVLYLIYVDALCFREIEKNQGNYLDFFQPHTPLF